MSAGKDKSAKDKMMAAHMNKKGIQRPGSTLRLAAIENRLRHAIDAGKGKGTYFKVPEGAVSRKDMIGRFPFK